MKDEDQKAQTESEATEYEVDAQTQEIMHEDKPPKSLGFFSRLIIFINFIIAIVALVMVGYVWQQFHLHSNDNALHADLTAVQKSVSQNTSDIQSVNQAMAQAATQRKSDQAAMAALSAKLENNHDLWQLTDAQHLIQTANYTLSFSHDAATTSALLKTADSRLAQTNDPKTYPLRKQLADDIATLDSVKKVDVAGVYMQLEALQKQIVNLPIYQGEFKEKSNNLLKTNNPAKEGSFTHGVWHAFSKVVVIRHHRSPINPLLSYNDHVIVLQNLNLLFSLAEWGLIHRNAAVYQDNINKIVTMLNYYYDHDGVEVTPIVTALQKLAQLNINPTLPDIRNAVVSINQLVQDENQSLLAGMRPSIQASAKVPSKTHKEKQ